VVCIESQSAQFIWSLQFYYGLLRGGAFSGDETI
jgi:hypothetical protein